MRPRRTTDAGPAAARFDLTDPQVVELLGFDADTVLPPDDKRLALALVAKGLLIDRDAAGSRAEGYRLTPAGAHELTARGYQP